MRKSQKKILLNNALMIALAIAGLLLVVGWGVVDKIIGAVLIFAGLGFIK